eukprot:4816384-Prymnesium_polylepis.1
MGRGPPSAGVKCPPLSRVGNVQRGHTRHTAHGSRVTGNGPAQRRDMRSTSSQQAARSRIQERGTSDTPRPKSVGVK